MTFWLFWVLVSILIAFILWGLFLSDRAMIGIAGGILVIAVVGTWLNDRRNKKYEDK